MKIFAAGIATETNTFSPLLTAADDFLVVRGRDVLDGTVAHPNLNLSATWGKLAQARGDTFSFSLMAWAEPGGLTLRGAYESLRDEMLRDLEAAMPLDIILLNLHGAMMAQGYVDCEQDILQRVRAVTGPDAIIGVELDLHCNLTEAKLSLANLVITYKEYPHIDPGERARELFQLAVATKLGEICPTMALFDCRMIGLYPTSREPMRGFVDSMTEGEKRSGVLSISFAHGFHFADLAHVSAKTLAITDNNPALAAQVAREFGLRVYGQRHKIGCESFSLPMDVAFDRALKCPHSPVVIADQSDNPGGGAPGDATFALRWLIDHGVRSVAVALIYDPEVVKVTRKAGMGAFLALRLGGKLGLTSGMPIDLQARVTSVREHFMQPFPQTGADPDMIYSGALVALHSDGIDIVVSDWRSQCFSPLVFSELGLDPNAKRLLVVKSTQHFHAAFEPIAAEIIYMSAPGAVNPDPRRISYRNLDTHRLYPWTEDPFAD